MPEGDNIRFIAERLGSALAGEPLTFAYSPVVPLSGLIGRRIAQVRSHGKQLLIEFDNGRLLRTHLRMNGRVLVDSPPASESLPGPHVRWLLSTAKRRARCIDAPTVELMDARLAATHPVLSELGPDLLAPEFALEEALTRLVASELPLGSALMDQTAVAGIGNVYKSEVLFLTRTSPFVSPTDVPLERLREILLDARRLLQRNVGRRRRTTPEGRIGSRYWVYERSGEPCLRCGARVRMQRQDPLQRSTYFCPECQAVPPERSR